jgi:hypothetical protein
VQALTWEAERQAQAHATPGVAGYLQPLQQRPGQMLPPFRKGDEAHAFTAPPPFERVKEEVIALMEKEQRQQRIEARLKVLRAAASIQKLDAGPV